MARTLCRQLHDFGDIRHGQQIMVREPVRTCPTQMVGDERSVDQLRQCRQAIQVLAGRWLRTEQVQSNAMQHDRVTFAYAIQVVARSLGLIQEVFADQLEIIELRPRLTQLPVVAGSKSEPERIASERPWHT